MLYRDLPSVGEVVGPAVRKLDGVVIPKLTNSQAVRFMRSIAAKGYDNLIELGLAPLKGKKHSYPVYEVRQVLFKGNAIDGAELKQLFTSASITEYLDVKVIDAIETATNKKPKINPALYEKYGVEPKTTTLAEHENGFWQGHTMERHVAKSESYLRNRLQNSINSKPKGAKIQPVSSYYNEAVAEEVVNKILQERWDDIITWLDRPQSFDTKGFDFDIGKPVGKGIGVGDTKFGDWNFARIVLVKIEGSFKIKTSYPIKQFKQ